MLRRAAVVVFAFAIALVAACGHQVTPSPTTNNLAGEVVVRLTTAGPLDFNNVTYAIAVDTCGLGVPYPQAAFTSYLNYSYMFFIGGFAGTAQPELIEYYFSGGNITYLSVPLDPSTTQFVPNFNGQGTQLQFTFQRADLDNPKQVTQPCPNITAPPSGSPVPAPTTSAQATWIFNVITFNTAKVPLDSLGLNGATDASFPGLLLDTTSAVQNPFFRLPGYPVIANQSAQLLSAEVDNYP